jgi:hypothetical protein
VALPVSKRYNPYRLPLAKFVADRERRMAMLSNATHYEQVSLETLKKILDRTIILREETDEKPAAQPSDRTGNRSSVERGKERLR